MTASRSEQDSAGTLARARFTDHFQSLTVEAPHGNTTVPENSTLETRAELLRPQTYLPSHSVAARFVRVDFCFALVLWGRTVLPTDGRPVGSAAGLGRAAHEWRTRPLSCRSGGQASAFSGPTREAAAGLCPEVRQASQRVCRRHPLPAPSSRRITEPPEVSASPSSFSSFLLSRDVPGSQVAVLPARVPSHFSVCVFREESLHGETRWF